MKKKKKTNKKKKAVLSDQCKEIDMKNKKIKLNTLILLKMTISLIVYCYLLF